MGRMWRGGYRRFHPIGDRVENEMVDVFDVGQPICDLDMKYGVYKVPAKEVIPYRIYPVLSPAWKADGYDELGIIYDRYLDLLVTYVVEGESETDGYAAAIMTYDNLDTFEREAVRICIPQPQIGYTDRLHRHNGAARYVGDR